MSKTPGDTAVSIGKGWLMLFILSQAHHQNENMDKDKIIKNAQYRKGLSIAFFNATNAAVEFAKINGLAGVIDPKKFIAEWRDWFLEEHKNYYATVIANVGVAYKAEDSIAKLKATKTLEDLQTTWRLLSADERKDFEIIKVAQELRKGYGVAPATKAPKVKNEKA
jgi:hypothetical protein